VATNAEDPSVNTPVVNDFTVVRRPEGVRAMARRLAEEGSAMRRAMEARHLFGVAIPETRTIRFHGTNQNGDSITEEIGLLIYDGEIGETPEAVVDRAWNHRLTREWSHIYRVEHVGGEPLPLPREAYRMELEALLLAAVQLRAGEELKLEWEGEDRLWLERCCQLCKRASEEFWCYQLEFDVYFNERLAGVLQITRQSLVNRDGWCIWWVGTGGTGSLLPRIKVGRPNEDPRVCVVALLAACRRLAREAAALIAYPDPLGDSHAVEI
jgi:hypothetical protein